MNARVLTPRHDGTPEFWVIQDGVDQVTAWIDESGFHSKRYSPQQGRSGIAHGTMELTWGELIARSEKQPELFDVKDVTNQKKS